jgi:hypothetical protein
MFRYFFHMVEGRTKHLVRDLEGSSFSNTGEARKEAIGLARDIIGHGLHGSTWRVVVTDENGRTILTVPLAENLARKISRKMRTWLNLARRIAAYEPKLQSHVFTWLLTAAMLAMIIQAAVLTPSLSLRSSSDRTALAAIEGTYVRVRFFSQATVADVTKFLDAYKVTFVDGPQSAGLYRLRISDGTLPREELAKIVSLVKQEKIVAFAAE